MGTSSSATEKEKEKGAEAIADPKSKVPPPEFNYIVTGFYDGTPWSMNLFLVLHKFADHRGHIKPYGRYTAFVADMIGLRTENELARRRKYKDEHERDISIERYEDDLNGIYDKYIIPTGPFYLELSAKTRGNLHAKKKRGWKDERGVLMTPEKIWDEAEEEVITRHLEELYEQKFTESTEYKDWLKTDYGKEYKKWLKGEAGTISEEERAERVSKAISELAPVNDVYEGMKQNADWANVLWTVLDEFCHERYCADSTSFIKAAADLKRLYYTGITSEAYVDRLNEMYEIYVTGAREDEYGEYRPVNIVKKSIKEKLKTLFEENWQKKGVLLSPEEIWDAAVNHIINIMKTGVLEYSLSTHFGKNALYIQWQENYGRNYMHWVKARARGEAGSSLSASASKSEYINYFNKMMDYQGSSEYLPCNELVDYQHDRNYHDLNTELMAFFAIIMICIVGIIGFCSVVVCMFNFFNHYICDIKPRYKKEEGVSDEL